MRSLVMVSMHKTLPRRTDHHGLDGLAILRAVVEAGSFAGAGEALGLTQPAVSRAVAKVEGRIGIRLFRRTARSISLTDEGQRFFDTVAPHLRAIDEATTEASRGRDTVRGRLRVNVDAGIAQYVIVPRLGPFLERNPGLFVELAMRDRTGDLVREGFDVAVRFGLPEPSALKAKLLLRTRIVTCASPAYLARHGTPRSPKDIERHQGILVRNPATSAPYGWDFVKGKRRVTVKVGGALMVNGGATLMEACRAGLGVAQLLELYARPEIDDGTLTRILPDWSDETYPLYAYFRAERGMSAAVRAFLDYVAEIVAR